ncbi:MAG: hypothetical protein HY288_04595, partial [Planctomycetia bacterium]|nr:hypothetical protein [Planctomycetia bacterium]
SVAQAPTIGSLSDNPDPVIQGSDLTLTANSVSDSGGMVAEVEFYRDVNGNGSIDVGTDTLLGTDINGSDGWASTVSTSGFALGDNTYMARAQDNHGPWSNPATTTGALTSLNIAPSFTKGSDPTINEDAGAQTVASWATAISAGPPNESSQTLNFILGNNNNALFSAQPAISPTGTLTFTPAPNASGTATVTVQLHDNGGIANGGVDSQTFTISITPLVVNHAPSFRVGSDQVVSKNSSAHAITNLATNISAGPANESAQAVTFQVTTDNRGMFSVQPAIDSSGNLSYTVANNAVGISGITVVLKDNGGTNNGGIDTSAPQTFSVAVVNGAPYQNQSSPFDVNNDHSISASDVLNLINWLLDHPAPDILPTVPPVPPMFFVDVNGDGMVTPKDLLAIINDLLNHGAAHPVPGASSNGATPLASADAGVASALASTPTTSTSTSTSTMPAWIVNRLAHLDLNSIDLNRGPVAKYLLHLAHEGTPKAKPILVKADEVADALNVDDTLLDSLLAGLAH